MRIVFINPGGMLGGGERSLLDLMAALRAAADVQMHVIACGPGPLADAARALGAEVVELPMPRALAAVGDSSRGRRQAIRRAVGLLRATWSSSRYVRQLRRTIERIGPDLLHSNGIKSHVLSGVACGARVPAVWHVRDFIGARPLAGALMRWTLPRRVRLIAVSNAVADDLRCVLHGEADDVQVDAFHDAIDVAHFAPAPNRPAADLDALAGMPPSRPATVRVGLVATYARWKGQDLLLRAFRRMIDARRKPGARVYIIGGPIYQTWGSQYSEAELRALADGLGVSEHVGFVPFQMDAAAVYRALDVVVHASTRPEPFGRTIAEAMASGRAVIATRAGGAGELFKPDVEALAVKMGDAADLAEAITRLVASAKLRQRLGEAAARAAARRFSRRRLATQVLGVYRELLAPAAP